MKVHISFARSNTTTFELVKKLSDAFAARGTEVVGDEQTGSFEPVTSMLGAADCVVAVLSDPKESVIFEIGYAVGAGKPVLIVPWPGIRAPDSFLYLPFVPANPSSLDTTADQVLDWATHVEAEIASRRALRTQRIPVLDLYQQAPGAFEQLSPEEFESAVHELLSSMGYEPSPITRREAADAGFDFELRRYPDAKKTLVDVKKLSSSSKVPVSEVHRLLGLVYAHRADAGILISASGFTTSAAEFAKRCGARLELWDMPTMLAKAGRAPARAVAAG